MTIAVTGATGQLGRLVIADLKAKVPASDIIALVRDPAKAADLGVQVRVADYTQPQALEAALHGVDTLMLISANEVGSRTAQHQNIIVIPDSGTGELAGLAGSMTIVIGPGGAHSYVFDYDLPDAAR